MNKRSLGVVFILFLLSGCATTEYHPLPDVPVTKQTAKPRGVYHKVKKGETVFRIAKTYGVAVEDVISANNIPNAASIEIGQLVLIPGAGEVKDVVLVKEEGSLSPKEDLNKDEFAWPVRGKIISYYKDRRGEGVNKGIDIEAAEGEKVKASREGKVVLADDLSAYQYTVMIDHGDGFTTVYAKNQRLLVKVGDKVYKGDPVAEIGSEAGRSFLHFEIRKGKDATNPLFYLS